MKRITWSLWLLIGGLTALWLLADTLWPAQAGFFPLRTVWVQYTGVLAMGMMSVAMLLAVRPTWLEPRLGGLDKMYRLHKWLGIGGLALGTLHWLWAQGTKWAVGWGWLERPHRGGAGPAPSGLEGLFRAWRGTAEGIGEWAFYVAALLIVLALVKRFPYRLFAKTHTLLAVTYLVLVFHSVVLLQFRHWAQPVGWAMALLLAAGTVSAVLVLTRQVGAGRRAQGTVEALDPTRRSTCWRPRCAWMGAGAATGRGSSPSSPPAEPKGRTPTPSPRPGTRPIAASPSSPRRWATTRAPCRRRCTSATA